MSKHMPAGNSLDGWMQQIWAQARLGRGLAHAAGALSAFAPALVLANPTGGQVVAGSATIGAAGANGVIVNQNSQRASINWQQFSIGTNEYVQFVQPNSSSVVLNRVIGSNPSSIFGNIRANGQVFLINPNGILFAPGSTLDVSSLTASTLDISDADFMAGRYVFAKDPGAPDATVVNQGNVTVTAGGYVVLAGDYVENDGVIQAQSGKVLLAAGGAATLTLDNNGGLISYKIDAPTLARLAGVDNAGSIVANGGAVVMTADVANALTATAVNNSGFVTAHSVTQQGGEIELLSEGGGIENSGTLDATANTSGVAGGTVILKGDGRTRLTDTSVIDTAGDGAKGGFIDVSGHELNLRGLVHAGKDGTLLLDPFFLHIVNGSANTTGASTNNVGVGWINNQLKTTNVVLHATDSIMNVGHVARTIHPASGSHNLTLEVNDGTIDIRGLTITIKGSLDIQAAAGSGGSILMNGATAKAITLHGSTITVAGGLTATSGGISVTGRTSRGNHNPAFSISGAMHATGRVLVSYSNEGGVPTGVLKMHDVTAGTIKIVGEAISTGNLTATQSVTNAIEVEASGSSVGTHHNLAAIQVTGNVIASHGGVFMSVQEGDSLAVTGKVTAGFSHASLTINHSNGYAGLNVGGAITGPEVNITAKGLHSASINVAAVTATQFDVNIKASDYTASGTQGAGIRATGVIKAAKNVALTANGGSLGGARIKTGAITAYTSGCPLLDCNAGNVHITANNGIVSVAGAILVTASAFDPGGVTITATKITTGQITAGASVVLDAIGNHNAASITVNGAIQANSNVSVDAHGSQGGNVLVTGAIVSTTGNVVVKADNTRSASGGNISAGNISAARGVTVFSRGGATGTPLVKVGSITAGSEASINVQFTGNSVPLLVQTGAISAGAINIQVKGHGAKFTAPSLKATGPSSTNTVGYGSVASGFIKGLVSGSHHSASFNVTGTVKSVNGNVTITAAGGANSHGGGAITTGNITGGLNVTLKGNDIQVGSVTAGSFVSITGESHSATAHITATGLVKGRGVFVNANGNSTGYGSFGGSIDLAGGVTATGTPGGGVSSAEVGIHIKAETTSTVKMNITTGALTAAGGSISVIQKGGTGGVTINGAVHASTGGVDIETHGTGSLNGGSISISGSITAAHGVVLDALNPGGAGAKIKVNGSIIAGNINIATSASTGGDITITGGLTASSGGIFVTANSSGGRGGAGGNIHVTGATKASHGSVSFFGRGAGNSGGNINVGKVTALHAVSISGSFLGTAEASVKVQTGNVKGESVIIKATGPTPIINTGTITATGLVSSAGAHDYVKVLLSPIIATRGKGSISIGTVTGNGDVSIQALGGAVNTAAISAGTGGDVDVSGSTIHVGGAITAIGGSVCLTGSSVASHATKIKVTGTIQAGMVQIKASPGSSALHGASIDVAKVSSSLSGGIMIQAETTANVKTQITTGALNATGTGANAGHIDVTQEGASGGIVTGNITAAGGSVDITATGSGGISVGKITAHTGVDLSASGSHAGPIVVTGTITATTGNVSLNDSGNGIHVTGLITATAGNVSLDASGGSISAGAITAGLDITLLDQGITGGGITVNGNLTASNTVSIKASNHSGADIKVTGKVLGDFGVTLLADAGSHSGGNIKVTGLTSASVGNVRVTAKGGSGSGGNIKLGAVTATGSVSIGGDYVGNSPGFTLQTGKVTAEKVIITMTGKDPVMTVAGAKATGPSSAVGFVQLQLNPTGNSGSIDVTGGITTAHGEVDLSGGYGAVILGNNKITTGGTGGVFVHGGQVHLGSISAGGGISVTAVAVSGHAGSITAGATTLMTGKYVNLDLTDSGGTKGNIAIGGVTATGTAGSSHGGKLSIDANMGSKKVTVSTGTLTAVTSVDVSVNDHSGSASLGKLDAPTVHVSIANGKLTVGQLVHAGASLTASNGSITDTTAGSLDLVGDKFNTTHGVHLKAGTNIILSSDNFGSGGLSASAGGKLVENSAILNLSGQVLKAKQLVLSGTSIDLDDAKLTASSIQVSATSVTNNSAHGSIVAAKGDIRATHRILLVGESIFVSGAGPLISAASVDMDNAMVGGTGILSVTAAGDLDANDLRAEIGGLTLHGGSVDLTGAKILAKALKIDSGKDVNISAAQISGSAVGISAARNIVNGSGANAITAGAGGLTLKAKGGDVQLAGETLKITGAGSISAAGSLSFAKAKFSGVGTATLHAGTDVVLTGATLALSGMTVDAVGGSIDLTGASAAVSGQLGLQAKHDIILSGVHITAGTFIASASGTIHNGGGPGAITAAAIKVDAKKDIDLSDTTITIGDGALTGVTGDAAMLQLLAAAGLKPASALPNGTFIAGGSLTLGDLDITGNYLVLQGSSISILGKVTAPTSGLLVEVRPGDPAQGIDVEGQPNPTAAAFDLSNQAFFALFPGDTIVVGDDVEAGDVHIGTNGPFTLAGGTNLLFDTTGTITGLGNILGTGLVGSLETVAGSSGDNNVVTAGEIDPSTTTTSLGDQTDKKHLGHGGPGFGNEGQNGSIGTDTDTSSVCH